ncbi:MAG: 3'-5' exonuclease, partial [Thermoguttaceae bacterium]
IDLICDFISELKRLEIWPDQFRAACTARGLSRRDSELIDLYESYQQSLTDHQLYDDEGRLWSVRDRLQKEQPHPLRNLRRVVVDGFTDFTRTQHEILQILSDRVEQLQITLPLEPEPRREDLFAKPLNTLAELERRHAQLTVEELPPPADVTWPAMSHLERKLFANPRRAQAADDTEGIEIIAAARQLGEIQQIASRIKRLLTQQQVPPGDVAVVLRNTNDVDSLIREVFAELGIPVAIEDGHSLDCSSALRALVCLLRLDIDDFPALDLLATIGSNYFNPDWPQWRQGTAAASLEKAIQEQQLPGGRKRLLERLAGSVSDDQPPGEEPCKGGPLLKRLAAAFDTLPREATLGNWAAAWEELARDTGLLPAIEENESSGSAGGSSAGLSDLIAWNRLREALRWDDMLWQWMGEDPPLLGRNDALAALVDVMSAERVGSGGDESGRVRVLSATSVRGLRIPYLFLAGLSERAFPPPQREDRLYSEADYQQLIEQGLPLVDHGERGREEMLLFYEAITRASQRLCLSYPSLDGLAQPLSPSPYLAEVEQACGENRIARTEAADLSPVPAGDDQLSAREFRIKAISTAVDGNVSLLAGLLRHFPDEAENIIAGLLITQQRADRNGFGPTEGVLGGRAAKKWFAEKYSLEGTFSATNLESYATCPYRFFAEKVLKLRQMEDLTLALDVRQRGWLAHEILALFHQRVNQNAGHPLSPSELDEEEFNRLLSDAFDETIGPRGEGLRAAMKEVDRRTLMKWMAGYRQQHLLYDKRWKDFQEPMAPELFEVSFGRTAKDDLP